MAINREAVVAAAEKLVARGKIEGAIKEYRKLVADNPSDAMTINRLGDLYVRIDKNEEAVKLFLQIADRYTDDGFFVKAIAIFKKIIKLDPTRLPVYERLAELYHKQGLVTEARTQYQVLVDYYLKHGKIDAAETVLRKMTALDSGDPTPHVKLAEIFRDRGEHDKELHEYRLLAEMMLRHKRADEAAQVYARAIAAAPTDLGFITDAVLGLKDAGHPAAAAKLLALAIEKNPQAEKIARIAGIGDKRKLDATGVHSVVTDTGGRVLKVSDVAPAPPELRAQQPQPRADSSRTDTPRPSFLLEEIELDFPAHDRGAPPPASPHPEEPEIASSASALETEEPELEFVLEIEGVEVAEAPTPEPAAADSEDSLFKAREWSAPRAVEPSRSAEEVPAEAQLLPEIDWAFAPEPSLELDLELPPARPLAPAAPAPAVRSEPPPSAREEEPQVAPPRPVPAPPPTVAATAPTTPAVAASSARPAEEPIRVPVAAAPPALTAPVKATAKLAPSNRLADLLAEAEVFRKHGLAEKANDRLRTILSEEPRHPGALSFATIVLFEDGRLDRSLARGQQLERLAAGSPAAAEAWAALKPRLEKAGFRFEAGALAAAPEPKKKKKDSVGQLLDELSGLVPRKAAAAKPAPPKSAPAAKDAAALSALVAGLAPKKGVSPAKPTPAAAPSRPASVTPPLAPAQPAAPSAPVRAEAVVPPPSTPAPASAPQPPLPVFDAEDDAIDDKLSWLDEAAARAKQKPAATPQSKRPAADDLFADEDGFFDLAAELEEELSKEEVGGREAISREEPSLESIVEGFKKGVAESLSPEDYDTHFNLGIAYKEMGLLDEAIGEFQLAAKHPNYLLDCCSLLGICFQEKGLPELAVKWFQRGLSTSNLTEGANLGLLYDLGNLYQGIGDEDRARRTFVELYGINSNYRDVVARLEELGTRA